MKEQKYRELLWKKASKEFDDFKNKMLNEKKEAIFITAYRISILNDFTNMCDRYCNCLSLDEVKALLKKDYPVHTLYSYYMKSEAGSVDDMHEAIWYQLSNDVKALKEEQKSKKQDKNAR